MPTIFITKIFKIFNLNYLIIFFVTSMFWLKLISPLWADQVLGNISCNHVYKDLTALDLDIASEQGVSIGYFREVNSYHTENKFDPDFALLFLYQYWFEKKNNLILSLNNKIISSWKQQQSLIQQSSQRSCPVCALNDDEIIQALQKLIASLRSDLSQSSTLANLPEVDVKEAQKIIIDTHHLVEGLSLLYYPHRTFFSYFKIEKVCYNDQEIEISRQSLNYDEAVAAHFRFSSYRKTTYFSSRSEELNILSLERQAYINLEKDFFNFLLDHLELLNQQSLIYRGLRETLTQLNLGDHFDSI